jgi:hypothetical protein
MIKSVPLLSLVLALGCAAPRPPAHLLSPEQHPPPMCPAERFISEARSSEHGRLAAEALARDALVKRLNLTIETETKLRRQAWKEDGSIRTSHAFHQFVKERARFAHAHFITFPDSWSDGESTYVLACLDRHKVGGELRRELPEQQLGFLSSYERALTLDKVEDWPKFTLAYREAFQYLGTARARMAQVRVLLDEELPGQDPLHEKWQELLNVAGKIRSRVSILVETLPGLVSQQEAEAMVDPFRRAFGRLGVGASETSGGCRGQRRGTYLFQVTPASRCQPGYVDVSCRPYLSVVVTECGAFQGLRTVATFHISEDLPAGTDLREERRALRLALQQLEPALFERHVRKALASEVPLPWNQEE